MTAPTDFYEKAARYYCADVEVDPDELIRFPHPQGFAVVCKKLRWQIVAEELRDLDIRSECLRRAPGPFNPGKIPA